MFNPIPLEVAMNALFPLQKFSTFLLLIFFVNTSPAWAASAAEIDVGVNETIARFTKEVGGAESFLKIAKGVLVFPKVYKAGIGIGGEYGEGALRVGGKTVDYYSTAAASFGFQLGAQAKSIIILFIQEEALKKFRHSEGWKVGVDGSVALVDIGAGKEVSTQTIKDPIVGFIFDQKGLMYNLTLEGSKMTKLDKK
jgi:lipid-binding SYLF domain-containing protein